MDKRAIKKIIKSAMLKKDIRTGILAERIGMESLQMSVWLSREDGTSLNKLTRIAEALGCEVALIDKQTGEVYK